MTLVYTQRFPDKLKKAEARMLLLSLYQMLETLYGMIKRSCGPKHVFINICFL